MLSYSSNFSPIAQRALGKAENQIQRSMQRISSGLRINGAADDAAGLAISLSMGARIRSANQASRNATDGISLARIAEQGLAEITGNLSRLRELAVQAANGTLSLSDRQNLQAENDQMVANISQIAQVTRFNGIALLSGATPEVSFQVGPDAGNNIVVSLRSAEAESLGPKGAVSVHGNQVDTDTFAPNGTLIINGQEISIGDGSGSALADGINGAGIAGLTAIAAANSMNLGGYPDPPQGFTLPVGTFTVNGVSLDGSNWVYPTTTTTSTLNPNGTTTNSVTHSGTSFGQALSDQINSLVSGVSASYSSGQLVLTAADGRNIDIGTSGNNGSNGSFSGFDMIHGANGITSLAGLELSTTSPINISQGLSVADGQGRDLSSGSYPYSLATAGLLLTKQKATDYIGVVDVSLEQISQMRGQMGSLQNVLEHSYTMAQNSADNLAIARSRILDTDLALESAGLVRGKILQQAGIAILAQANQAASNILSLLQSP